MTQDKRAYLVVNADDAGCDSECDRVIITCFEQGLLTCCSLIPNGLSSAAFARRAVDIGLDCGLHLNLSEGPALTGEVKGLTDAAGHFLGDKIETWRRLALGAVDRAALREEIEAQWSKLALWGLDASHLDGHNHVHMFRVVAEALADVLPREYAGFLRVSSEVGVPEPLHPNFGRRALSRANFARTVEDLRWRLPDHFLGFRFSERPDLSSLSEAFPARRGITEFMVHPGCREGSAFSESPLRDREMKALLDESTRDRFQSAGYKLVSFRELT